MAAGGGGVNGKGGVYVEMYRVLKACAAGGREIHGDQRVKAVYEGGDKEKGIEIKGARRK